MSEYKGASAGGERWGASAGVGLIILTSGGASMRRIHPSNKESNANAHPSTLVHIDRPTAVDLLEHYAMLPSRTFAMCVAASNPESAAASNPGARLEQKSPA